MSTSSTTPGRRRLGVVVNPSAGKGRGRVAGHAVISYLHDAGHDVWDLSGRSAALASERAQRALREKLDALVVVGGDGMVHLGLQVVAGTDVPLGIVPVGTGNDFASALGLPTLTTRHACDVLHAYLSEGEPGVRAVDAVYVTGHVANPGADGGTWFAGALSAGLDAAVNARANAMVHPRGSSRYTIAALGALATYLRYGYHLTFEGVPHDDLVTLPGAHPAVQRGPVGRTLAWTGDAAVVTAANGPRIGGGMLIAPHASTDDGLLDVVIAANLDRAGAALLFPRLLAHGRHLSHPAVHVVRCRAVTVEARPSDGVGHPPAAYADGELLGTLPLRAEVRPGALRVLAGGVGGPP
ncbi:diacylglycerol/lipid kinase family protein [Antribacter gilvus]|uniref:diacylglycerol/lipid kinase family protein n=1 Tax=Antribacter gilvus TaxID=2304675 RepID=UPI000F766E27|nr:diacylglycerol kinase family protein [Antribacter gilvus]